MPSEPSMAGLKRKGSGNSAAMVSQDDRRSDVVVLRMHAKVDPAVASVHAVVLPTNASHTTWWLEALETGKVPAEPDSMIYQNVMSTSNTEESETTLTAPRTP